VKQIRKVIILGSGGLSIGQAGEFDYSGSQAVKALLEEGIEVVVVNPNIATIQTDPSPQVKVYLYPVEPQWVEKVIVEECADAIIGGFGGQTALNCLLQLDSTGILKKHGVTSLGTSVESLLDSEDRGRFSRKMAEISVPTIPSHEAASCEEACQAANRIGYPVIVRAGFALGGLGSGFAKNELELRELAEKALEVSKKILVEKSLWGWKELEYEVMRDRFGNVITICNMENIDPLGIHTGDSMVVAPSQTLNDEEFQLLRNTSIRIANHLQIVGECNVQFALDPKSKEFYVIEINARLSRSSALASKATGYPIAYIAAKVVLGRSLVRLKNPMTQTTSAFFEPAMDYVVVKVPRWDLQKFPGVSDRLGSSMKSVGEVMAIGVSFLEAFQKAIRMVTESPLGLCQFGNAECWSDPTDTRVYSILQAIRGGQGIAEIHEKTHIDLWFLRHFDNYVKVENEISEKKRSPQKVSAEDWKKWKRAGFSDDQLGYLLHLSSLKVREERTRAGVIPVVRKIDTTAAEHPSHSNYLYLSYHGVDSEHSRQDEKKSVLVLGAGPYRIGTSVEFDWCAVNCMDSLRAMQWRCIMLNCNPETVSTDYNRSDSLYFEELSVERILDIANFEGCKNVLVSMGGQLPNKLAKPLARLGFTLLGHSFETLDKAEDRNKFSALLDTLNIDQPDWVSAESSESLKSFISKVGYPVLVRPSYVLSGAAMKVAYTKEMLESYLESAREISPDHPVVVSKFIEGAREIEVDGIAQTGELVTFLVSEHVEEAGTHSGDATIIHPAINLSKEESEKIHEMTESIAKGLGLNGPFNIQMLIEKNSVKVIECNARASRSFPFVSKTSGINLAALAADVFVSKKTAKFVKRDQKVFGVKAPVFSFNRLSGADPVLGVEMVSTGEVGCLHVDRQGALLLAFKAAGMHIPKKGILVSAGRAHEKQKLLAAVRSVSKLGLDIYATPGTHQYLSEKGIQTRLCVFPGQEGLSVETLLESRTVDFVINLPKSFDRDELAFGTQIRKKSIQMGCTLVTNVEKAIAFINALDAVDAQSVMPASLPEYLQTGPLQTKSNFEANSLKRLHPLPG
jgi:carbamoyl-phosphate synthase large subunit